MSACVTYSRYGSEPVIPSRMASPARPAPQSNSLGGEAGSGGRHSERFWNKVDQRDGDECWPWLAAAFTCGYGAFYFEGQNQGAHRVAWLLVYGEIPGGQAILHRCDNMLCVRPSHLFLGTQTDNMRDMVLKGRQRGGGAQERKLAVGDKARVIDAFQAGGESISGIAR